jgi:peptide deformylase
MFVMATPKADVALPTLGDRVHSGEFERNPVHFTAFVNPRVVAASEELECDHETCLSIPGITALVPRHEWIDVEFTSLEGETCALRLQQHPARVFQHELDHLEGIVFLDRILATGDIMAQEEFDRQAAELMKKQGALLRAQRKEAVSSALDVVFEQYV